jgi:transcriptional repressor NrdR
MKGLLLACQKRPVSLTRIEELVGDLQARLMERPDREIRSRELGELIMDELKGLDQVAYVRFASVYRDFKDLPDFVRALEGLMHKDAPLGQDPLHKTKASLPADEPVKPMAQALFPVEAGAPVSRTRKK